ncbi:hypothetical protein E4U56_005299 [Claviceps arundinis]|uniref:SET domain-containing protein n=1 Tax=Claviceps arundinis TaxID=1623583 RepID=A0A9P7MW68_9HYPO|nr:hypothetical protein E4U56_005299 [Claviceps arundinis]
MKANYILFQIGERPTLPFEGSKFLRFSSKCAKLHFGLRVVFWNELFDQQGHYSWDEVHKSVRSYEQPDAIKGPIGIDSSSVDVPLYEIKDLPGKGRGLMARVSIPKGTRILVEKPLVIAASQTSSVTAMEKGIENQLRQLSEKKAGQFFCLHNSFRGVLPPFTGTVQTNALACGEGSSISAVYPTLCLINNACRPNCQQTWNQEAKHETIHAIRDIAAGEEITIAYIPSSSSAQRRHYLKEKFRFDCACEMCVLPAADIQASDDRRAEMESHDRTIANPLQMMTQPEKSLAHCRSMLKLLDEEYPACTTSLHTRAYYDAFQICIAHGDQARASIFAEKSYEMSVVCQGEDSPSTKKMKSFVMHPSKHTSFELCSRRWKTSKKKVNRKLKPEEFEKWLWRE